MAMISKETVTVGILAIASGLASVYGIRAYLKQEPPPPVVVEEPKPVPALKIPIATLDLPSGRRIAAGDIAILPMSREKLLAQQERPELVMVSPKDIIGRRLRQPLKQGEPFLTTGLYPAGGGPNVAEKLKTGYRALSLYIADGRSNGIEPGAFVDILFRTRPRGGSAQVAPIREMTVTLLTNVEVLDFVAETSAHGAVAAAGPGLATLAVPVDQVNRIEVLQGRGQFSLMPRAIDDAIMLTSVGSDRMTLEDALGIEMPPPAPAPFQTTIYRRGDAQVNTFVDGQLVNSKSPGGSGAGPASAAAGGGHDDAPHAATPTSPFSGAAGGGSDPDGGCAECKAKREAAAQNSGLEPVPSRGFAPQGQPTPAVRPGRRG